MDNLLFSYYEYAPVNIFVQIFDLLLLILWKLVVIVLY